MNKKPVIGIVGRFDKEDEKKGETKKVGIGEYYIKMVNKYGGIPIGILPTKEAIYNDLALKEVGPLTEEEKEKLINVISLCDGILMPGGNKWYEHDEFIAAYAHDHDIPVLGICMGMQLMGYIDNKYSNASTDKTYYNQTERKHDQPGVNYVHPVKIEKGSILDTLLNKEIVNVNSRHNYNVGHVNNLKIAAISDDGLIEAIYDPNLTFYLGLQWHPELMDVNGNDMENVIKEFIKKASK